MAISSLVHWQAGLRPTWTGETLLRLPSLWLLRSAWRRELAALDAGQLRDCGLDPAAVGREVNKPFWRS